MDDMPDRVRIGRPAVGDIVERLGEYSPFTCAGCDTSSTCGFGEPCDCFCHVHPCHEAAVEIERLRQEVDLKGSRLDDALDEIDRLRREVLELRGVVRAHEGMYTRAAEEIDRLRGWLERTYRMAVGHGPNWKVFDGWEEAINAYEEARRG